MQYSIAFQSRASGWLALVPICTHLRIKQVLPIPTQRYKVESSLKLNPGLGLMGHHLHTHSCSCSLGHLLCKRTLKSGPHCQDLDPTSSACLLPLPLLLFLDRTPASHPGQCSICHHAAGNAGRPFGCCRMKRLTCSLKRQTTAGIGWMRTSEQAWVRTFDQSCRLAEPCPRHHLPPPPT